MSRHADTDRHLLDHFPVCPHCGELCGRLAEVCSACGSRLFLTAAELERAAAELAAAPIAELELEASPATRERSA